MRSTCSEADRAAQPATRGDSGRIRDEAIQRLKDVIARLMREPAAVDAELEGLGPAFFAVEGGWREAFESFRHRPGVGTTIKVLALREYQRFLEGGNDVRWSAVSIPAVPPGSDDPTDEVAPVGDGPGAHRYTRGVPRATGPSADFERLPPQRLVRLSGTGDRSVVIWMAERRFVVEPRPSPQLVAADGRRWPLGEGRQYVGRAPYNDVVLDADWGDISRQHVMLNVIDGIVRSVTDLSSGGTFVPRNAIAATWC